METDAMRWGAFQIFAQLFFDSWMFLYLKTYVSYLTMW